MPRQNVGSETGDFRTPTSRNHLGLVSGGVSTPINSPILAHPNSPAPVAGRGATPSLYRASMGLWPSPGFQYGSPMIGYQRVPTTPQQRLSKYSIVAASDRQVPSIPTPKNSPWTPMSLRKVPHSSPGDEADTDEEKEAIVPKRQAQQIEDGVVPILDCSTSSSAYGGSSSSPPSQTTENDSQTRNVTKKNRKRNRRTLTY